MSKARETLNLDMLLCFNVYALNLALGRLYQSAFGETGFTYPKFVTLLALSEDGPMSLTDLAARVGSEPNSLSPMIKKMSEFGLIERVRDEADERRILLSLLPFGQSVLEEANTVVHTLLDDMGLTHMDVDAVNTVLAKVRTASETTKPSRIMRIPDRPD